MGGAVRVGRRKTSELRWDPSHLIPLSSHQAQKNYFAEYTLGKLIIINLAGQNLTSLLLALGQLTARRLQVPSSQCLCIQPCRRGEEAPIAGGPLKAWPT